ncbi:SdrD B-like domain-containing protein [Kibdelosporangium persicum]|uniref:SD-repeat containing protein B domain-containing protein n=1 Tax=Kibdelosporangium persicum TaxID=2698649 RepID=A0ABX2FBA9_9PSEU|nr:SdrD B-like domain-containing protein [Kibdelosporangium persicum]NRN68068.1 hypothetical protein [Kibdelosporangium persicum]
MTNSGADEITGVVATCNRADNPVHLLGSQNFKRWGELAVLGQGTTVKAGETRTYTVDGLVPEGAIDQGVVFVHCDVGRKGDPNVEGFPRIFTLAKVPGKNGTGSGLFYHDKDNDNAVDEGEHVRGLVVTLTDPLDGTKIASATTGADGGYRFENIPAGWYVPVFQGPWKMKFNEFVVVSADGFGDGWAIPVVPGPAGTAPVEAPRGPVVQAKKVSADQTQTLATTGANVIGLTIGGIAVLALGIGAVLFTRKRRRT